MLPFATSISVVSPSTSGTITAISTLILPEFASPLAPVLFFPAGSGSKEVTSKSSAVLSSSSTNFPFTSFIFSQSPASEKAKDFRVITFLFLTTVAVRVIGCVS